MTYALAIDFFFENWESFFGTSISTKRRELTMNFFANFPKIKK